MKRSTRRTIARTAVIGGALWLGFKAIGWAKTSDAAMNLMANVSGVGRFRLSSPINVRFDVYVEVRNPSQKTVTVDYAFLDIDLAGFKVQTMLQDNVPIPAGKLGRISVPANIPIALNAVGMALNIYKAVKAGNIKGLFANATVAGFVRADGLRVPINQTIPVLG